MVRGASFESFLSPGSVPHEVIEAELVEAGVPPEAREMLLALPPAERNSAIEILGASTESRLETVARLEAFIAHLHRDDLADGPPDPMDEARGLVTLPTAEFKRRAALGKSAVDVYEASKPAELSDFEKKGRIIEAILDDMMPLPEDASGDAIDLLDLERSALVQSSGWDQMSTQEMERVYLDAGNEALPY